MLYATCYFPLAKKDSIEKIYCLMNLIRTSLGIHNGKLYVVKQEKAQHGPSQPRSSLISSYPPWVSALKKDQLANNYITIYH